MSHGIARERIYLDHAATCWPRSDEVIEAMVAYTRQVGSSAGRGSYRSAGQATEMLTAARRLILSTLVSDTSSNVGLSPDCVSFHSSGTLALNAAIQGVVSASDHVVTTAADHNSVLRPLIHLQRHAAMELEIVPCDTVGRVTVEDVLTAVRPETKLVAVCHASNVTGAVQPIAALGAELKDHPAAFLVDAAQSWGQLPIDVVQNHIDLLAAPGHKAGGGPMGTGFLYVAPNRHESIVPFVQGGTGGQSESLEMPSRMPQKLEPGNVNVPAIAGWKAGLLAWAAGEHERRAARGHAQKQRMVAALNSLPGVTVHTDPESSLPLVSFTVAGIPSTDVAAILDAEFGVEVRAGWHCAAKIHQYLGTTPDGTVRLSPGPATTDQQLDFALECIANLVSSLHV
ncbi:MAG: aminotransferase class V-fold PLP-dependent enzyme [Planctomycetota bacterium]